MADDNGKRTTVQVVLDGFDKFRLRDFRTFAEEVGKDDMLRDALLGAMEESLPQLNRRDVALEGGVECVDAQFFGTASRFTDGPTDNGGVS